MGWYGVDFGTTNSSISIFIEGKAPIPIRLSSGIEGNVIPTVAFINDGNVTIGEEAKTFSLGNTPGKYLANFKTLIGENTRGMTRWEKYVERGTLRDDFQQQCIVEVGGSTKLRLLTEEIPLRHQGQNYNYREIILAMREVFTFLKSKADEVIRGIQMDGVVIGIPVDFPDTGKDRIIDLALKAGLASSVDKVVLLSEPLGVALAYGREAKQPGNVLVFDFGGGTLDLTLVEMAGSLDEPDFLFNVIAKESYDKAGSDIDGKMLERIVAVKRPKFWENANVQTLRALPGISNLLEEVEKCKIGLSQKSTVTLRYTFGIGRLEITRDELTEILQDDLREIRKKIESLLQKAKETIPDLEVDAVLLAGGSSNIPAVKDMLIEMFSGKVLDTYAGSGKGTVGLALAAKYHTSIQDIADSSYAIWDYGKCEPIIAIQRGERLKSEKLIKEQQEHLIVTAEANQQATPAVLANVGGKWQPIGKVMLRGHNEYLVKLFIEPKTKRISILVDDHTIEVERADIPFLELGQIIRKKNTEHYGCIEKIRHLSTGLNKEMALGDMHKYVITIYDAWKNSTIQLREPAAHYEYYDIGLPEPGEFVDIKRLYDRNYNSLPTDSFASYQLVQPGQTEAELLEILEQDFQENEGNEDNVEIENQNNEDQVFEQFPPRILYIESLDEMLNSRRINQLRELERKHHKMIDYLLEKYSEV